MDAKDEVLLEELTDVSQKGIPIDVEGISYADREPKEVVRVMQRGMYMMDYESDDMGYIVALHIDRVCSAPDPCYKTLSYRGR